MSTNGLRLMGGLVAFALCTGAYTFGSHLTDRPVFTDGQYTATLEQGSQHWTLLPIDGQAVELFSPERQCVGGNPIPVGVWLVTRDSRGRPELLAPSVTHLPPGHEGHVALVACGEKAEGKASLEAPQILIDVLAERTGAVYVSG